MEQIGHYKIVRQLNTEGSNKLYEAVHEKIQRRAVIKILEKELAADREVIERFLNQARAVNLINHPSIVNIYEHGQLADGSPYIVMEWLSGETLRDRLRRLGRRMEPALVMRLSRPVASALAAAHAKQIVHRDLKPGSVMLIPDPDTPDGERVKVLNFGIAKLATTADRPSSTEAGVSMGTPTYMSPEQCRNARDATDRSDVYSLAVLMYEMLAGGPPFRESEGVVPMMMAHMHEDAPPLANRAPEASAELCALVHRMLAKAPEARPGAAEVATILGRLSGRNSAVLPIFTPPLSTAVEPPTSPTAVLPPPPADEDPSALAEIMRQPRGRLIIAGAGAAMLLGFLGILAALFSLRAPPAQAPLPQVTWSLASEPPGAELRDETGQVIGHTPWQISQPRGAGIVVITVRKSSFREEKIFLDRSRDLQREVTLSAVPAQPETAPPPPAVAPSKPKSEKKRRAPGSKRRPA